MVNNNKAVKTTRRTRRFKLPVSREGVHDTKVIEIIKVNNFTKVLRGGVAEGEPKGQQEMGMWIAEDLHDLLYLLSIVLVWYISWCSDEKYFIREYAHWKNLTVFQLWVWNEKGQYTEKIKFDINTKMFIGPSQVKRISDEQKFQKSNIFWRVSGI